MKTFLYNTILLVSLFFITISFTSCSHNEGLERREFRHYHQETGVTSYFLPGLPNWANFSEVAQCKRSVSPHFLNLEKIRASLAVGYEQSLQIQYLFNEESRHLLKKTGQTFLPPSIKQKLFFSVTDKVQAGILAFKRPIFKRIHLIWIDPLLGNVTKIKKLLNSSPMNQGHPVFVSLCNTREELRYFLKMHQIDNLNIRLIPIELFSIFNTKGDRLSHFYLDFSELFSTTQKLYLFLPKKKRKPLEFGGHYRELFY